MDWKWRRLEKDWRWTDCGLEVDSMDEIGTGGGLHKDPWGSVRYRPFLMCGELVSLDCSVSVSLHVLEEPPVPSVKYWPLSKQRTTNAKIRSSSREYFIWVVKSGGGSNFLLVACPLSRRRGA